MIALTMLKKMAEVKLRIHKNEKYSHGQMQKLP
jgi:hypothetical protein